MRRLAALVSLLVFFGCFSEPHRPYQPVPVAYDNPVVIPIANPDIVWEGVRDVVSQYFRIEREEPLRPIGNTVMNGRIDTYPMPGATLLEPWYNDSANNYERLESTLQSIRRYAVVKLKSSEDGTHFYVDVAVFKELENLRQPEHATAGSATFRSEATVAPRTNPAQPAIVAQSWIAVGRDVAAEQRIIGQILDRFTPAGTPVPIN